MISISSGNNTPLMADTKSTSPPLVRSHDGSDSDCDFRAKDPNSGVKWGLKTGHLSMMALAGIIGPGLLVGSGGALESGGPAALLIGFGVIGIIAFSIMQSLEELTTLYPTGRAFVTLSDRFVGKAFAVAVGWNYWIILEWQACRLNSDQVGVNIPSFPVCYVQRILYA